MKVVIADRQTGKSTYIAEKLAADPQAICIVPSRPVGSYLEQKIADLSGRTIEEIRRQIHTAFDVRAGATRGLWPSAVYIDELDAVLHGLIGHGVSAATGTMDLFLMPNEFLAGDDL